MNLLNILQSTGLSEQESTVYLKMAGSHYLTATQISKACGMKRSSIYYVLDSLLEKGIIITSTSGVKKFKAQPPEDILNIVEREQDRLDSAASNLKKALPFFSAAKPSSSNKIEHFRGLEGTKMLNEFVYKSKSKKVYTFGVPFTMVESPDNDYLRHFHKKRVQKGIKTYSLWHDIPKDNVLRDSKKNLVEARIAPKEILGKTQSILTIVDDSVIVINLLPELNGMRIDDKTFSSTLKCIWDAVWAVSTPVDTKPTT